MLSGGCRIESRVTFLVQLHCYRLPLQLRAAAKAISLCCACQLIPSELDWGFTWVTSLLFAQGKRSVGSRRHRR
eukprot:6456407-Amphidinium_carterae.2